MQRSETKDLPTAPWREKSQCLEAFFRHSLDCLVFLDKDFNFLRVNEAYARACRRDISEFAGHNHFEFYPHAENEAIFREVVRLKTPYRAVAKPFKFPDHPEWGTTYWDWTLVPILDADGEVELLVFMLSDVSARTEAARRDQLTRALLELFAHKGTRKEYLDAVAGLMRDWCGCRCLGIRVLDARANIPYESYVGFSREFWELENWLSLEKDACACVRVVAGTPDASDVPLMTPAGSFRCDSTRQFLQRLSPEEQTRYRGNCVKSGFASVAVIPIRYGGRTQGAIHLADERDGMVPLPTVEFLESLAPLVGEAIHRFDVERQLRTLNEMLERRAEQLRALAAELTLAEQRERRRLAQLLHDHLQQLLYGARLSLGALKSSVSESLRSSVEQVDELLRESLHASRSLTMDLCPPIVYDAGLGASLEWLGQYMQETYGLSVDVEVDDDLAVRDEDLRILLFQATRELLFNAVKHAQVSRARLTAARPDRRHVEIVVSDKGIGFDPKKVGGEGTCLASFGLFGMRQRLELVGGFLEVDAGRGRGTRVTVRVPCPEPAAAAGADEEATPQRGQAPSARSPGNGKIRVLVADDHRVLREGLARLLREQPDMHLVGEAGDGRSAVELALRTQPDVIVMDVTMPHLNGVEATRRIVAALPGVRVVGLSMHEEEDMARAMIEAGAAVYLPKGGPSAPLIQAIRGTRDCEDK